MQPVVVVYPDMIGVNTELHSILEALKGELQDIMEPANRREAERRLRLVEKVWRT